MDTTLRPAIEDDAPAVTAIINHGYPELSTICASGSSSPGGLTF